MAAQNKMALTALSAIKQRLAAATPGNWLPCLGSGNNECTAIMAESEAEPFGKIICDLLPDYILEKDPKRDISGDREFIIHARTDIEKLLKALELAVEQRDEYISVIEQLEAAGAITTKFKADPREFGNAAIEAVLND